MSGKSESEEPTTAVWPVIFAGGWIVWASLAHVPAVQNALNYFDPPKRMLWALMALTLALAGGSRENRLGKGSLWIATCLLLWLACRTLFRPVPAAEIEVLFTWMMPILMLIVGGGIENRKGVRILGGCLLLAGLIQASIMLFQRGGLDPLFSETTSAMAYKPGRMVGTIGYQNQAADFLALSGTGIFLLAQSPVWRLAVLLPLLLVSGLTGNRGGVLAFIAALLVSQLIMIGCHPRWGRRVKWRAGLGALAVVLTMSAAMMLVPETRARFQEAALHFRNFPATASRILMVRIAGQMFRESPWMGWGAGEYALQYLDRLGSILPEEKTHPLLDTVFFAREAHNDGIQFAAEFGIIGVLLASVLLAALVLRLARSRHRAPSVVAAEGFILTYMAVAGLVSFPWQTSMAGPLAGFLLGWWWPQPAGQENVPLKAGTCFPMRIFRILPAVLSMGLMAWFGLDLYLNLAIPARLISGVPAAAERLLPRVDFRYRALVGAAYAAQGELAAAEMALCKSQRGFQDVLLWRNLNHVYARMGKWGESVAICEKWARCGLDYSNARRNLSIAYEQTGRFDKAAEILAREMKFWHTHEATDIKRLAVLQLRSGQPQAAHETLLYYRIKWMGLDAKTVAEMENLLGASSLAAGDKAEAKKWFLSALKHFPDLESARSNLEGLPAKMEDSEEQQGPPFPNE